MKNITEIERKIISAQKEMTELDARRSALLERIKQLQEARDIIKKKASTPSLNSKSLITSQSSEAEKVLFSEAFSKEERTYILEDLKAAERVRLDTNLPVEMNG